MRRTKPPTYALRPINPDNTRGLRITAAAGTKLATPYSPLTINQCSALYECSNRLIALPACRLPIGRQGRQARWVLVIFISNNSNSSNTSHSAKHWLYQRKKQFTTRRPSSCTRRRCVRLSSIAQYSRLRPSVDVRTVTLFHSYLWCRLCLHPVKSHCDLGGQHIIEGKNLLSRIFI